MLRFEQALWQQHSVSELGEFERRLIYFVLSAAVIAVYSCQHMRMEAQGFIMLRDLWRALLVGVAVGMILSAVGATAGLRLVSVLAGFLVVPTVRMALLFLATATGIGVGLSLGGPARRFINTKLLMPSLVGLPDQSLVATACAIGTWIAVSWASGLGWVLQREATDALLGSFALLLLVAIAAGTIDQSLRRRHPSGPGTSDMHRSRLFYTDAPIERWSDDLLSRAGIVNALAKMLGDIKTQRAALVVAVTGQWGTGKTSVLKLLGDQLSENRGYVIVRFDPWHFNDSAVMLGAFFRAIESKVSEEYLIPDLRNLLQDYLSALTPLLARMGVSVEAFTHPPVEVARVAVSNLIKRMPPHLVIMLDDLDRLTREELLRVLQLLKLTADFENATYIVAMDRSYVEKLLKSSSSQTDLHNESYLDKFVDLQFTVDYPEQEVIDRFLLEGLRARSEHFAGLRLRGLQKLEEAYRALRSKPVTSLRDAKRVINAFSATMELLPGEVNVVDVAFLEMIKRISLDSWRAIRGQPDYFVSDGPGHGPSRADAVQSARTQYYEGNVYAPAGQRGAIVRELVESVFPATVRPTNSTLESRREQRAADSRYFFRYFGYTLGSGIVSDVEIQHLVASLHSEPEAKIESFLASALEHAGSNRAQVFDRLVMLAAEVAPGRRLPIAAAVARLSKSFVIDTGWAEMFGEMERARVFVFSLANCEQRGPGIQLLLETTVREATSLVFAGDIVWFSQGDINRVIEVWDNVDWPQLRNVFDEHVSAYLLNTGRDLLEEEPMLWQRVTSTWSNKAYKGRYLRQLAQRSPWRIGEVVEAYLKPLLLPPNLLPEPESVPIDLDFEALSRDFDVKELGELIRELGDAATRTERAVAAVGALVRAINKDEN